MRKPSSKQFFLFECAIVAAVWIILGCCNGRPLGHLLFSS